MNERNAIIDDTVLGQPPRRRILPALGCAALLLVGACGGRVSVEPDARPTSDARQAVDAGAAAVPSPAKEVVSGGGRVEGGTLTLDVQVGHAVSQKRTSGTDTAVEGGAVIKP